ncbi:MAG: hypothetical protein HN352_14105 [Bacteroidetes bacterium]|nr:hypothetical protein [Bacteroidota bacterium]MBT5425117.1 hypothetical protein [Bacteroidota bacterium]MBT7464397.1 hypothetical protein [Bacteroidota bacterium]
METTYVCVVLYVMFRKISHIILSFVLLMVTSGFTIHQHFCCGNLIETKLFQEPKFCCGEGSDCCSNESETYLLDEDYVSFIEFVDFQDVQIDLPPLNPVFIEKIEAHSICLNPIKILHPPDTGTVLARLQVFCL